MTKIKLSDKEYGIEFTVNSFIEFEEETGKSMMNQDTFNNMDMKTLRALVWCSIKEDLTVEEVGSMIKMADITPLTEALKNALEESEGK